MMTAIDSLIQSGTKLWLDSIDPDLVAESLQYGASGATSNPSIVGGLIQSGRFDDSLMSRFEEGLDDEQIAWQMTDQLVSAAQQAYLPIWQRTAGNDGYVSFELDPLLEDSELGPPLDERIAQYIALGRQWSAGQTNRMIKVPATEAGIASLETLAAAGVTLNVTLIFTSRQYQAARDAVWRGAQRRSSLEGFKSVYSIFVSRVDVYTEQHVNQLSAAAQGQAGIVNAKRIWADNRAFWQDKPTTLDQEIIFASTGTKRPEDSPLKYIAALAGDDIQTNPPAQNESLQISDAILSPALDQLPPKAVLDEIDSEVDFARLEEVLLDEGVKKFADPQKDLLRLIAKHRLASKTQ